MHHIQGDVPEEWIEQYVLALQAYVGGDGERALQRAYELTREAMSEGKGLLDLATIHHEAMCRVLRAASLSDNSAQMIKAAAVFFVEGLTPFEMTHRAFRDANSALHRVNERLEEGARRIAHSLHDEAGQLLASVYFALTELARDLPPRSLDRLGEVRELLEKIELQLRHLSHELRPTILDDLGLMPALKFLAEGVSERTGVPVAVEGRVRCRFTPAVETAVYRIVQEALNNLTKHASASRAEVRLLREKGKVTCSIEDNGTGFDAAAMLSGDGGRGLGLIGIQERVDALGGTLQLTSAPGRGTRVYISIPTEEAVP